MMGKMPDLLTNQQSGQHGRQACPARCAARAEGHFVGERKESEHKYLPKFAVL